MNVLSLFSGIGGLDLGLERAGMTVVGQVEIDPWCRQILAKHWPEVPRHDDVRTAAGWWLGTSAAVAGDLADAHDGEPDEPQSTDRQDDARPAAGRRELRTRGRGDGAGIGGARPQVDLVAGGFPCQPVSLAGKGLAQADSRWLWPAFADIIRELRPRYALMENVPGLLGRGLGDVLGDLASIGYDAEWDCVPAVFVGAPHIRNRVWVVAYPQRDGLRQQPVTEPRSGCPAVVAVDGPERDVADAEGQRSELRQATGERPGRPASGSDALADAPRVRHGRPRQRAVDGGAGGRRAERLGAIGAEVLADATSQRRTGRVFTRPDLVNHRSEPAHGDAGTWRDGDWWAAEPDVGRVAHGIPRRVDRLRGLGNAVVPQVAEHIGHLIMNAEAGA